MYMSRRASAAEVAMGRVTSLETQWLVTKALPSELEEALNVKSQTVDDLTRSNTLLQEEILHLREDLELSGYRIGDLEEKNLQLNSARDEAIVVRLSAQKELDYYKSKNFKKHIIDDFKSSGEFVSAMGKEAISFIGKGCIHIIRQLYHHFQDKSVLL